MILALVQDKSEREKEVSNILVIKKKVVEHVNMINDSTTSSKQRFTESLISYLKVYLSMHLLGEMRAKQTFLYLLFSSFTF